MSKNIPQLLKGFRDYLPQEQIARRKIIAKISEVFERFGFAPIDTPALESLELLKGKIGEEEKLIYKFKDLGGREVALRYDLTVPLARVAGSYSVLPRPFKRYQIAPVWRAENPQKGRFREFMQCDADIVGSNSLIADAEVIATINEALMALEIGEVVVKFNNRELIDRALTTLKISKSKIGTFMRLIDKIDKLGKKTVLAGLKKEGLDEKLLSEYEKQMEKLGKPFVEEMKNLLSGLGVANMEFDKYLARGLAYYTGPIFEFILKKNPEFGSIAGGGRYDKLVGKISGTDMPAVGCSIGLDRLLAALEDLGVIAPQTAAEVIVFNLDKNLTADYLNITTNLRNAGIDTEFYYEPDKLDKQFKYAASKNIQLAVIFGSQEAKERKVNLKDLIEKKQVTVDLDDLITEVRSMLW